MSSRLAGSSKKNAKKDAQAGTGTGTGAGTGAVSSRMGGANEAATVRGRGLPLHLHRRLCSDLFRVLLREQPMVLCIEDAHQMDERSWAVVLSLADVDAPSLILLTHELTDDLQAHEDAPPASVNVAGWTMRRAGLRIGGHGALDNAPTSGLRVQGARCRASSRWARRGVRSGRRRGCSSDPGRHPRARRTIEVN